VTNYKASLLIILAAALGGYIGTAFAIRSVKLAPAPLYITFNGSITVTNDLPALEIR
jgi:hypothetical protein